MGKQKDFRKVHGASKRSEKNAVKALKNSSGLQTCPNVLNIERLLEDEIEFAFWRKKLDKVARKELERYPMIAKAVYLGCERAVDELLEAGENINVQTLDGNTLLMIAVDRGHTSILQKLLKRGADLRPTRKDGKNAILIAVSKNENNAFSLLWNHFDKTDFSQLNQTDSGGYTILTTAVERDNVNYANLFTGLNGLEIDRQTIEGKSALMLAAMKNQKELVQSLLNSGADVLLEDKFGATALCFALAQEHVVIGDMLQRELNTKDKEAYVKATGLLSILACLGERTAKSRLSEAKKNRVELLSRPRHNTRQETTNFYKRILFRVILKIKKVIENGIALLLKYRVFFGVMKCIESYQCDLELQRLAFHLSAYLMYDKAAYSRYIILDMAGQFIEAKGPDYCTKALFTYQSSDNRGVRGSTFLPIHACVECPSGKQWLKDNYVKIFLHMDEFRNIMPEIKYWAKDDGIKAKIMFERFEEAMKAIAPEFQELNLISDDTLSTAHQDLPKEYKEQLGQGSESSVSNAVAACSEDKRIQNVSDVKKKPVSSSFRLTATGINKKKKPEFKRKFKNIKFHTKYDKQNKIRDNNQKSKVVVVRSDTPANCFSKSHSVNPNLHTGYADALKRNLNSEYDDESKSSETVPLSGDMSAWQQIIKDGDILLRQSILGSTSHINSDISLSSVEDSCSEMSHHDVLESFTPRENSNAEINKDNELISGERNVNTIVSKLREGYNFWSKVPILAEPSKLLSYFRKTFSPNSNNSVAKGSRETVRVPQVPLNLVDEVGKNQSEQSLGSYCVNKETYSSDAETLSNFVEQSSEDIFTFDSKRKPIDTEVKNLCTKFENLILTEADAKSASYNISLHVKNCPKCLSHDNLVTKEKKNKQTVVSRFLATSEGSGEGFISASSDATGVEESCDKIGQNIDYVSGQAHSDMTQSDIKREKNVDNNLRRTYSDVTRTNIEQVFESENCFVKLKKNEQQDHPQARRDCPCLEQFEDTKPNRYSGMLRYGKCYDEVKNEPEEEIISTSNILRSRHVNDARNIVPKGLEMYSSKSTHLTPNQVYHEIQEKMATESNFFGAGDALQHSNEAQVIGENNFRNRAYEETSFLTRDSELRTDILTNQTVCKIEEIITQNGKFQDFRSKLRSVDVVRHRLISLEDMNIPPMTYKLKLGSLQKYASLYHRMISHNLHSRSIQTNAQKQHLPLRERNYSLSTLHSEPLLPRKHPSPKKQNSIFTVNNHDSDSEVGIKNNNTGAEACIDTSEDINLLRFVNNFLKMTSVINPKRCSDSFQRKLMNLSPRSSAEYKRKMAREEVQNKRRARISKEYVGDQNGTYTDTKEIISEMKYLDSGYVSTFINCEAGSAWYSILKSLKSCVPLAQHLLHPEEMANLSKSTLHHIDSAAGKITYGSKLEHTLREGAFGTYIGLIEDGCPVVVRQLANSTLITDVTGMCISKKRFLKHRNLTTFYDVTINPMDLKTYFITELCEYSLPQHLKMSNTYISESKVPASFFRKLLVIELVEGIRFLHEMQVIHGFLKPSNIMVTIDNRLKLTDYYLLDMAPLTWGVKLLESKQRPVGSSISKFCWRPTELIMADNKMDARARITTSSDVQMCGMLVYFILSGGKHPFGSSEKDCQENIKKGTPLMGSYPEETEARDLVLETIKAEVSSRPTIEVVMKHPYFWDIEKRFQFLRQVGWKITFYTSRPTRAADEFRESCLEARDWTFYVQQSLILYMSEYMNKTYRNEFPDFLQFAIALQDNFETLPGSLKCFVMRPAHYILLTFPTIFMSTYHVIRRNSLLQKQMGLQTYF